MLGRRYGLAARFLLNYDFTFLAILLSVDAAPMCSARRCLLHPCKGCLCIGGETAFGLAADCSLILAWWQIRDHIRDSSFLRGLKYRLAALCLYRSYLRAKKTAQSFDVRVQQHLTELAERESGCCDSLDAAADSFAALLAEISLFEADMSKRRIYYQLFYHLGRWIYLVDAADDYADDMRSGNYNPIRYRFGLSSGELTEQVKIALGDTMDASIRKMAAAYELLNPGIWKTILDSVFYESMYAIGKAVLSGEYHRLQRHSRNHRTEGKAA